MPSIYNLNPPPNPFWDFFAEMQDHPSFTSGPRGGRGGPRGRFGRPPPPPAFHHGFPFFGPPPGYRPEGVQTAESENVAAGMNQNDSYQARDGTSADINENEKPKQATVEDEVEDPPIMDPSTVEPVNTTANSNTSGPRGRGRFASAYDAPDEAGDALNEAHNAVDARSAVFDAIPEMFAEGRERVRTCGGPERRGGMHCRGRGRDHGPRHGPPPFMFGRHPWFARPGSFEGHPPPPAGPGPHGPPGHGQHHSPPPPPHGPRGPHGPHERRGPHGHGDHGHRRPSPPGPRGPQGEEAGAGFNIGEFLNTLANRFGLDTSNIGNAVSAPSAFLDQLNPNSHPVTNETDFSPRTDIFSSPSRFTIHLSLPGAKKSDVGVDYDGENSLLRITGVVHRPEVDEEMLAHQLMVDGRKRETGVFEKAVRLGTRREPADVDVAGITAKMTDGVLIVQVPKVERSRTQRREVPVEKSATPSPDREETLFDADQENEKDLLIPEATDDFNDEQLNHHDNTTRTEKGKEVESHTPPAPTLAPTSVSGPASAEAGEATKAAENKEARETLPTRPATKENENDHSNESESEWEKYSDDNDDGEFVKINVD